MKMFDIYDLIPKDRYQTILEAVQREISFDYSKLIENKFSFRLESSTAGCDWEDGTKKGDYLVWFKIEKKFGDYHGFGYAIPAKEFMENMGDYEQCTKEFDRIIDRMGVMKECYVKMEDTTEQLGFELGI